jgi:HPt (histidine-containing phosphotransfer) domain-containing protein
MAQSSAVKAVESVILQRAGRPIDLVHLAKQCLGDEHLEYEILRLFDTTIKTYFARIQAATAPDDLRLNLHSIKGAATGVGAWTIADLAKSAETELGDSGAVSPEALSDLGHAIEETSAFITVMLSNEPA